MQPVTPSPRPSLAQRAPASFSLLALLLIAGSAAFAGCGDDGSLLGSDNSGGSAGNASSSGSGQTSGGSAGNASSAGNGHAGTQASGGTTSGGTTSGGTTSGGTTSGGTTSGGAGGATCETGLCARANVCLDECGGNVVYTGCCQCEAGTVEQLSCSANGGQGSGGQASSGCVGTTCTASQSCVAYRTIGGAVSPPDSQGNCANGKHVEGNYCQADFGYTCAEIVGCGAADTCRCAPNTQCAHTNVCRPPSDAAWLDSSADLVCEQLAP